MIGIRDRLPPTLSTERLVLTTPALAHVGRIAELANNKAVHANMSRLPFPYSEDEARFFVDHIARAEDEWNWAIEMEGHFVGAVGLHFQMDALPVLGFWLGEPFWGRGIVTEAGQAVVAAARAAGATGLASRALKTNVGSRAVQRKLGFAVVGEEPEHASSNLAGQIMVMTRLDFSP